MTRTPLLIALAAAAALAGCNKDHTIAAGTDGDAGNAATNAPVVLPPTIAASKIYRCADNKVIYVDWLSDNKSANVRTESGGVPTQVVAAEVGKPMTSAAGFSIEGTPAASSIKAAVPGRPAQICKA